MEATRKKAKENISNYKNNSQDRLENQTKL